MNKLLQISMLGVFIISACQQRGDNKMAELPVFNQNDMDLTVNPGNNFYLYANGGWMKNNPLPDDKSRFGAFDKLAEDNKEKVKSIIEEVASISGKKGAVSQQIGDFFSSGMDIDAIESAGIKPLQATIDNINSIDNKDDLIKVIAQLDKEQAFPLFYLFAEADMKNSNMMIANIYQNGLGMPDRDYYTEMGEHAEKIRSAYVDYIAKLWINMGSKNEVAHKTAQSILKFETRMALASNTRLQNRDPQSTYNKVDLAGIKEMASGVNWDIFFTELNIPVPSDINIYQPKYLAEVAKMVQDEDLDTWRKYLVTHVVREMSPYLSSDFEDANFEFYGKTLSGKLEQEPRWKRVLNTTSGALGEAIGQLYVAKYFPPEAKMRMELLVENLRIAFGQRINELDWMSDSTKQKALDKLSSISVKIGYPNKWRDYSGLRISKDSYAENIINSNRFDFIYNISKIGKPVDKEEWHMTPQTVNAYYNPSANEIVFPAAILQPPFFYMAGDDAVNYGAIGVVIGHEMTHGFDDQGRQFDKFGNLNEWWQPEDAEKFSAKTKVLVDLFNSFVVKDTINANGELTLGENIADLGGLNISYQAFRNTLKNKVEPAKIDGFSADQRFFLAFARIWAQNIREEEMLRRVKEDVHSLGEHRVNGPLPNMDQFVKAFNIKPNDSLFISNDNRAKIW